MGRVSYRRDRRKLPSLFAAAPGGGGPPNTSQGGLHQMPKTLRVLLADDHRLMLAAIRLVLDDAGDIEVVGEATTGSQVLPLVSRTNPDPELRGAILVDDGHG